MCSDDGPAMSRVNIAFDHSSFDRVDRVARLAQCWVESTDVAEMEGVMF